MQSQNDPHSLQRFVSAQEAVLDGVRAELRAGQKRSHWMWYIFPQLRGLGSSAMANRYGLVSADEARAYLQHPVLGPRLIECTQLVNRINGRSLEEIFGAPDDVKFRSSMTLFAATAPDNRVFLEALRKYCRDERDPVTLQKLR
jgi:uncharacterized protein (DUF1810 family)